MRRHGARWTAFLRNAPQRFGASGRPAKSPTGEWNRILAKWTSRCVPVRYASEYCPHNPTSNTSRTRPATAAPPAFNDRQPTGILPNDYYHPRNQFHPPVSRLGRSGRDGISYIQILGDWTVIGVQQNRLPCAKACSTCPRLQATGAPLAVAAPELRLRKSLRIRPSAPRLPRQRIARELRCVPPRHSPVPGGRCSGVPSRIANAYRRTSRMRAGAVRHHYGHLPAISRGDEPMVSPATGTAQRVRDPRAPYIMTHAMSAGASPTHSAAWKAGFEQLDRHLHGCAKTIRRRSRHRHEALLEYLDIHAGSDTYTERAAGRLPAEDGTSSPAAAGPRNSVDEDISLWRIAAAPAFPLRNCWSCGSSRRAVRSPWKGPRCAGSRGDRDTDQPCPATT